MRGTDRHASPVMEIAAMQVLDQRGEMRTYQRPDEIRRTAERVYELPHHPERCVSCGQEARIVRQNAALCGPCRKTVVAVEEPEIRRTVQLDSDAYDMAGYAIVFDKPSVDLGGFVEYVRRGAVDRTLNNKEQDVRALWNHDTSIVLGRTKAATLTLGSDSRGVSIGLDAPEWGKSYVETVQRRDVTSMSFRFRTLLDEWSVADDGTVVRELLSIEFDEVSPVSFPAYVATSLSASKKAARAWEPSLDLRARMIRAGVR